MAAALTDRAKRAPGDWPDEKPPRRIAPGEAHVVRVRLQTSPAELERLWAQLAPDEQQRADRFRFARDRARYICAHARLRALLAGYLDVRPEDLVFDAGEYGKPFLRLPSAAPPLAFNLSHSGDIALAACALDAVLGVDVEQVRPVDGLDGLARSVFSPHEYQDWRSAVPEVSLRAFFNGWTRKEALVKAAGGGLSLPLQSFSVTLLPDDAPRLLAWEGLQGASAWTLFAFDPEPGYAAALAVRGDGFIVHRFSI